MTKISFNPQTVSEGNIVNAEGNIVYAAPELKESQIWSVQNFSYKIFSN